MPLVYGELHRAAHRHMVHEAHPRVAVANWTLGVVVAAMALVFAWRLAANLSRLARLEPQRFRWWDAKGS